MAIPETTIRIFANVPLTNRYDHTYWFASKAEQSAFFANLPADAVYTKYAFRRLTWDLKVEAELDRATRWSYLTFRNHEDGKDYYYFITGVEYVAERTVKLSLEMDVIQTYLKTVDIKPSYVERMHTRTDSIGEHTVDEGLDTGELTNAHIYNLDDIKDMACLILSTVDLTGLNTSDPADDTYWATYARVYDGVYSGLRVYAIADIDRMEDVLRNLDSNGKAGAIVAMWMYPKAMLNHLGHVSSWDDSKINEPYGANLISFSLANFDNYRTDLFEGYLPKNNKLFTYPYNFLYATNNAGDTAMYRYEWMKLQNNAYWFYARGALSPDATVKMYPSPYRGVPDNYDEGLATANYPSCAWDSDTFTVWLAQNQHSQNAAYWGAVIQGASSIGNAIGSMATLDPSTMMAGANQAVNGAVSAALQVQSQIAQRRDMAVQPPQSKGNFSSNVNIAGGRHTFTFYYKTLRREYARMIDDYFTMFGYRINRLEKVNLRNRQYFTYIKTIGLNLGVASMDNTAKAKWTAIFEKGITFWADPNHFLDYTVENTPLGPEA